MKTLSQICDFVCCSREWPQDAEAEPDETIEQYTFVLLPGTIQVEIKTTFLFEEMQRHGNEQQILGCVDNILECFHFPINFYLYIADYERNCSLETKYFSISFVKELQTFVMTGKNNIGHQSITFRAQTVGFLSSDTQGKKNSGPSKPGSWGAGAPNN